MRSIQILRYLASLKYNRSSLGGRVYKTETMIEVETDLKTI